MAKLRNVQFYRNSTVNNYSDFSAARTQAESTFGTQKANMLDGEFMLFRYTITNDTTAGKVHTLVGVVHVSGSTKWVEILGNYDELTAYIQTQITNTIQGLDGSVDVANATTSGNVKTITFYDTTETDGVVSQGSANTDATLHVSTNMASNNPLITGTELTNAIGALDGSGTVAAVSDGTTTGTKKIDFTNIVETDGVIGDGTTTNTLYYKNTMTDANPLITATEAQNIVNGLDATVNANSGTIPGYNVTGDFKVLTKVNEVDGKIAQATSQAATLKKVAATGAAADVSITDTDDHFTATDVEGALAELADEIESNTYTGSDAINVQQPGAEAGIISLTIDSTDNVLSQSDDGLKTTLTLGYNTSTKKIQLKGVDNAVITELDATNFIKDGMLDSASIVVGSIDGQGNVHYPAVAGETEVKVLRLVWNTDAAKTDTLINLNEFIDSYQGVDNNPVIVNNTTNTISHSTSGVTAGTYSTNSDTSVSGYGDSITINVPQLTVDTYGHVTAASSTAIALTMPSAQNLWATITSDDGSTTANSATDNLSIIGANASGDTSSPKIISTSVSGDTLSITHRTSEISTTTGTPQSWNTMGSTATIPVPVVTFDAYGHATAVTTTNYSITLPKAVISVTGENDTNLTNTDYVNVKATTVTATTGDSVTLESSVKTQTLSGASSTTDGLATAYDVKTYVDNHEPIVQTGTGETVISVATSTNANGATVYTLTSDVPDATTYTVTGGDGISVTTGGTTAAVTYDVDVDLAPNATVGDGTTPSTVASNLLTIDTNGQLSISDTWDCGTY